MGSADPAALEREWREQQAAKQRERERQLLPPSAPVPARDVARELDDAVSRATGDLLQDKREGRERRERAMPPPPPPTKWWTDPKEKEAIYRRADELHRERFGRAPLVTPTVPLVSMPGPPPGDFVGTRPGYMGATTLEGVPLSWADLQATRAAGAEGLMTDRGLVDLTRMSTVPAPPSMGELRAEGWQPIETRPEPGSPEYQMLGQQRFIDRMKGHFAAPELEMERPEYWEEVVRPSGVVETVGAGRWAHELRTPEAEERIGVKFSPRAFWRYYKAGRMQNVLGVGEALMDVGVTLIQQTAYWIERSIGELMLRNMVSPEQFRNQQETVAQGRALFPDLPGRPEQREQRAAEYTDLYRVIYESGLSPEGQHRVIAEVARMAYSPLPNQTRAAGRIAKGEDPNRVIAEEMDPLSEMMGQVVLDPVNWAMGPAASAFMGKLKSARSTAYWMNRAAQMPDGVKFLGIPTKWAKEGRRFGKIPEVLDPLALTRGARASKGGDSALTIVHHLATRFADEPMRLVEALKGLDSGLDDVMRLVGVNPDSEGAQIAGAILRGAFDEDNIDGLKSLEGLTKPVQATLEGGEEVGRAFNVADFTDEVTEKIYAHADEAYKVELDQYADWSVGPVQLHPGRWAMAVKGQVSNVYLGLNPGYLVRNAMNNFSTTLVDEVSTFRSITKVGDDFSDAWGLEKVPGYKRGLGTMAEIDKGGAKLLHKPAAAMEDWSSAVIVRHQVERGYTRGWRAADAPYFPKGALREYLPNASDEAIEWLENLQRASVNPQQFKQKLDEIYDIAGGKPPIAGGEAPRYPFDVSQLDPNGTIPHNVIAETQGIVDDFVRTGDEDALYVGLDAFGEENHVRTASAQLQDTLFYSNERGCAVLGPAMEGMDDLPAPLHFFPERTIRSLEKKAGLTKKEWQQFYAEAIEEVTGRPPAIPVEELGWRNLGDEEHIVYTQKVLRRMKDKGVDLTPEQAAYLDWDRANFELYTRSPADPLPGPFNEEEILDLIPRFRERVVASGQVMVDEKRTIDLMGFDVTDSKLAQQQARQLNGTIAQWGGLSSAEHKSGLRRVLFTRGDEAEVTAEALASSRGKLLEDWMEGGGTWRKGHWEPRLQAHGGMLSESDQWMMDYHKQQAAFLKGEAPDIPILRDLRSPLEAERMTTRDAEAIVAYVDEIKKEFAGASELVQMTDAELDEYAQKIIGQGDGAKEALQQWVDEADKALPDIDIARSFRDVKNGGPIQGQLPGKKSISTGSKPRRIEKVGPDGEKVVIYSSHKRGVIPEFRYDEWVKGQEAKYPGFYNNLKSQLVGGGNEEERFRLAVDMRLRKSYYQKKYTGAVQAMDEHGDDITRELRRRGQLPPETVAEKVGAVTPEAERVAFKNEFRDKLASGEYKPEDIDAAVQTGYLELDDAEELRAFNKRHWDLQDDQNRILEEEIARRQRKALETEPLGPEASAGRTVRPTEQALGQLPLEGDVGLSRGFALQEAMESGPSAFGGSRVSDAFMAQERYVDDFIWKVQNAAADGVRKPPPAPPGFFSGDTKDAIMRWADEVVDPSREGAKIIAETNAVAIRDFALLDYRQRKNMDLWMAMVFPYHYWYTRSGFNWLQRMATKPAAFNTQVRMQRYLREQNKDLPTRLRDSIGVPAPFLKEWMGDKLYIDPSRNMFAYLNLYPWAGLYRQNYDDPVESQNGYQEWGDLFDRVQMRPFLYIDLPRRWLSGEWSETYYQAPLTAGIKGTTALMREAGVLADTNQPLFIPPGGVNVEGKLREWVGMPRAYFTEETYWPAQHLAMKVATGEMEEDEAWDALHGALVLGDRGSTAWQDALQRGAVQRGTSQFGSFWMGQAINIYPRGEELMRKWSAELDKLGYMPGEREGGTAAERWEYLDEHPALGLRSAIFSYMGPKAWMFKNAQGVVGVDEFRAAEQEFAQGGGGEAALGRRYQMRKYGQELGQTQILKAEMENQLIKDGMVPGTRAFKVWDDWFREQISEPLQQRYEPYFSGGAGEPPFRASPEERLAWMQEQRVKALGKVYYDITPEQYADAEGEIDWDTFYRAREAAIESLPPQARAEFIQYLHSTKIPEEEAMGAIEEAVYQPLMDLIGAMGTATPEEKKLLQEELDALKKIAPEAAEAALLDAIDQIMLLHPEWGEEERNRLLDFAIPSLETWQRKSQSPRRAFEDAFETFYWGLPEKTKRITWDKEFAANSGVPDSYLGPEFEKFHAENKKLENLDEISDEQLLQWLSQTGQLSMLAEEGFPVPGEPLRGVLARIPGYEERVEGVEYDFSGVEGRAGARLSGAALGMQPPRQMGMGEGPGPTTVSVREGVPGEPARTEELVAGMEQAKADVAVQGEELSEVELVDPTFRLPDDATVAEIERMGDLEDGYYALPEGEERQEYLDRNPELRDLWEKYLGKDDSPKALWWGLYHGRDTGVPWSAKGAENNPLGWGLLPAKLKDNPFIKLALESAGEEATEADEDVYLEARLALEEYIEAHGEELITARDEYIGYIATLNEDLEELQDQYYEFAQGSQERRDFLKVHPELSDYWDAKRAYKDAHPVMVKYYFPPKEGAVAYQPRGSYGGWGGGGGRRKGGATAAQGPEWGAFLAAAGPEIAQVLIAYWTGQVALSAADRSYLGSLFSANPYGAASFEAWLDLLQASWQSSLSGAGEYEIPMRRHGVIVSPERGGFNAPGRPPTRVRYLRT